MLFGEVRTFRGPGMSGLLCLRPSPSVGATRYSTYYGALAGTSVPPISMWFVGLCCTSARCHHTVGEDSVPYILVQYTRGGGPLGKANVMMRYLHRCCGDPLFDGMKNILWGGRECSIFSAVHGHAESERRSKLHVHSIRVVFCDSPQLKLWK